MAAWLHFFTFFTEVSKNNIHKLITYLNKNPEYIVFFRFFINIRGFKGFKGFFGVAAMQPHCHEGKLTRILFAATLPHGHYVKTLK